MDKNRKEEILYLLRQLKRYKLKIEVLDEWKTSDRQKDTQEFKRHYEIYSKFYIEKIKEYKIKINYLRRSING